MRIRLLYKIAKKKKPQSVPIPDPSKSLQPVDPTMQHISKIMNAEQHRAHKIERMISPHIDIDPLAEKPEVQTTKVGQYEEGLANTYMTKGRLGTIYGGQFDNRENIKNYIKQLFEDNYKNNFYWLGEQDIEGIENVES